MCRILRVTSSTSETFGDELILHNLISGQVDKLELVRTANLKLIQVRTNQ